MFSTKFAIRTSQKHPHSRHCHRGRWAFTKPSFPKKADLLYLLKPSLQNSTTSQDDVRLLQICMQNALEFLRTCRYTVNAGTWTYPRDAIEQGRSFASVDIIYMITSKSLETLIKDALHICSRRTHPRSSRSCAKDSFIKQIYFSETHVFCSKVHNPLWQCLLCMNSGVSGLQNLRKKSCPSWTAL